MLRELAVIAKAILPERASRDTNWKQRKEYNAMNHKIAPILTPVPLPALVVLPDAALITLLHLAVNVDLATVVGITSELTRSVVRLTNLLLTSTLPVSTGMSPRHPLTQMRNQGFCQLCVHIM